MPVSNLHEACNPHFPSICFTPKLNNTLSCVMGLCYMMIFSDKCSLHLCSSEFELECHKILSFGFVFFSQNPPPPNQTILVLRNLQIILAFFLGQKLQKISKLNPETNFKNKIMIIYDEYNCISNEPN